MTGGVLITACLMMVPEYFMAIWRNCGQPECQRAAVELSQTPPLPELPVYVWYKLDDKHYCLGQKPEKK